MQNQQYTFCYNPTNPFTLVMLQPLQRIVPLLLTENYNKQTQHKQLPNFVILNNDLGVSNNLIRSMYAMLKQPMDSLTRIQIVNELQKLINLLGQKNYDFKGQQQQVDEFLVDLYRGLTIQKAINWYTKYTPIYKIFNSLIQYSRHQTQIFYIQPYFKDLFEAIKQLYNKNIQQNKLVPFTCYRGGRMREQQLIQFKKNIGLVIQNIRFLSTTTSQFIAAQFTFNVKFKINVNLSNIDTNLTYGFAQISKFSRYSQQLILFNPLNYFKIIAVTQIKNQYSQYHLIELQYGALAQKGLKKQLDLTKQQQALKALSKIQQQQRQIIKSQGDALHYNEDIKGALQYWLKCDSLTEDLISKYRDTNDQQLKYIYQRLKAKIVHRIVDAYGYTRKYNQVLNYYQKTKKLLINIYGYYSEQYVSILNIIGNIMKQQRNNHKFFKYFEQSLRISDVLGYQNSTYFAPTLNKIRSSWSSMVNNRKKLKYLEYSKQLFINLYGQIRKQTQSQQFQKSKKVKIQIQKKNHSQINKIPINQPYHFCYNTSNPRTLVMLEPPQNVSLLILTPPQQTVIIWISPITHQEIMEEIKITLGVTIILKNSIEELKKDLRQKRLNSFFILICQQEIECQADQLLSQCEQAKLVIYYPSQDETKSLSTDKSHKTIKQFIYISDRKKLLKVITQNCINNQDKKKRKHKQLPNFILLNNQVNISNNLTRSMIAKLKQPIDSQTRINLVNNFEQLINLLQKNNDDFKKNKLQLEEFLKNLRTGLKKQQAIKWYTKNTPIYKILNNILRSSRQLTQIFYIQPYFKDLFNAIKQQYENNIKQNSKLNFICFRGGMMRQQQLEQFKQNVGGVVQNLGFLSTTIEQAAATCFTVNLKFKINVNLLNLNTTLTYGFAQISKYSCYIVQEEVLFNPLNSFKIIKVEQIRQYHLIQLQYGILAQNQLQNKQNLTNQQIIWKSVSKLQKQQQDKIKSQGQAHIYNQDMKGAQQYWLRRYDLIQEQIIQYCNNSDRFKLKQIKHFQIDIAENVIPIATIYQNRRQYNQALRFYNIAKKLFLKHYGYESNQFSNLLNNIGTVLANQGLFHKSLKYYEQSLRIRKILNVRNSAVEAYTLNNIGNSWYQIGSYNKSLRYLQNSKQINIKIYGKIHPLYATTLANIAMIYLNLKQYQKALELLIQVKQILLSIQGIYNIRYATCVKNIGNTYLNMGKYREAVRYIQQSLNIITSIHGEQHPQYIHELFNFAKTYIQMDNYSQALKYLQKCRQITKKLYGSNNQYYARATLLIGWIYENKKQYSKALLLYQEAEPLLFKLKIEEDGNKWDNTLGNIIKIHESNENKQKTIEFLWKIVQVLESRKENKHALYSEVILKIGKLYFELNQFGKSIKFIKMAQFNTYQTNPIKIIQSSLLAATAYYFIKLQKKSLKQIRTAKQMLIEYFNISHPQLEQKLDLMNNLQKQNNKVLQQISKITYSKFIQTNKIFKQINSQTSPITHLFITMLDSQLNQMDYSDKPIQDFYDFFSNKYQIVSSEVCINENNMEIQVINECLKINCLKMMGRYEEAQYLLSNLLKIQKTNFLVGVLLEYIQPEISQLHLQLAKNIIIAYKQHNKCHQQYAQALKNMSEFYSLLAQYQYALILQYKVLKIILYNKSFYHDQIVASIKQIAYLHLKRGQLQIAEQYYRQVMMINLMHNMYRMEYAESINNMAVIYFLQGSLQKAQKFFQYVSYMYSKKYGESHFLFINARRNVMHMKKLKGQKLN